MKTKIEWTDYTWNPVWGCLNKCEYCYARSTAKRFGKQVSGRIDFIPTWIEKNFQSKIDFDKIEPSRIFVNSMSDIFYWQPEWMEKVIERIKEYPQHTFQFLTKQSEIYFDCEFPENCQLGVTITTDYDFQDFILYGYAEKKVFLSIEPMLTEIHMWHENMISWVIIGAETGNRKDKVIPKKQWIEKVRTWCKNCSPVIPYFEKDSIKPIVNRELIREFPR